MDQAALDGAVASVLSSWPEWLACLLILAFVVAARRHRRAAVTAASLVLVIAALAGDARELLLPVAAGGAIGLAAARLKPLTRWLGVAIAAGGAALTALLCWLFPVPVGPALPGPHGVGTQTFEFQRPGQDSPALVAQVWYPSDEAARLPAGAWLPEARLWPDFPLRRFADARSHARPGAPLAGTGRLPVIFYEHAWMGHRAENIAQVEHLASRGFVVIAVDHPGQACSITHADGLVEKGELAPVESFDSPEKVAGFQELASRCLQERATHLAEIRQALERGEVPPLRDRLELRQLGVFGFSFGGTSAIHLCATEPAFRAGANEDGLFLDEAAPKGPFLFFDSEMPSWLIDPPLPGESAWQALVRRGEERIRSALAAPQRFRTILAGTRHGSFTDRGFGCRYPRLIHLGSMPAREVHSRVTGELSRFFTEALARPES